MKKKEVSENIDKDCDFVVLDIETTGLHYESDEIISIGAIKKNGSNDSDRFYELIKIDRDIPDKIVKLTGITQNDINEKGIKIEDALKKLARFIGESVIVGYNVNFDMSFLARELSKCNEENLKNKAIDILPIVKKKYKFLDNYRLETVLSECGIINSCPHNALSDAEATLLLFNKLKEK